MLMLISNFRSQDLNHVIVFVEKLKYFIFFSKIYGQWYQMLFVNQLKPFSEKAFFESGSNFISEMSKTSVSRVVFRKHD